MLHQNLVSTLRLRQEMNKFYLIIIISICLSGCDNNSYQKRNGNFVFVTFDTNRGHFEHKLEGVDNASFKILDKHYAKDKNMVFFKYELIKEAESSSFALLSNGYARDNHHVFYESKMIKGADPKSFQVMKSGYGRDHVDIYSQSSPINVCDSSTFENIKFGWNKDKECIYRNSKKFEKLDYNSFEIISKYYVKDKNNVYFFSGSKLPGADPKTIRFRCESCKFCLKDKNQCYTNDKITSCECK